MITLCVRTTFKQQDHQKILGLFGLDHKSHDIVLDWHV
jgi:hypothetical protein